MLSKPYRIWLLAMLVYCAIVGPAAYGNLTVQMNQGGRVLMIRHAEAPGSGDPENFKLDDCATQRNLNDRGRAQAHHIGRWLRSRGVDSARIYSSMWCRCLETAELMGLGKVSKLPALNSFFSRPQDRTARLKALRRFLADQPQDGELIVLVTHFVTIAAITGASVSSGHGVLTQLEDNGDISILEYLDFGNSVPR